MAQSGLARFFVNRGFAQCPCCEESLGIEVWTAHAQSHNQVVTANLSTRGVTYKRKTDSLKQFCPMSVPPFSQADFDQIMRFLARLWPKKTIVCLECSGPGYLWEKLSDTSVTGPYCLRCLIRDSRNYAASVLYSVSSRYADPRRTSKLHAIVQRYRENQLPKQDSLLKSLI